MSNPIVEQYIRENPTSQALHEKALQLIPGGITHDGRRQEPFPFYTTRAAGARKWDADGHELIDYGMGHGALILGHNHPQIARAVAEQLREGTHFSASHPLEIQWAERITKLMPSAEMVRFVSSGTEATMMAMRLARAYTGREKILRFDGHFHGWHDYAAVGNMPLTMNELPGVPQGVQATMVSIPHDLNVAEEKMRQGDSAAVILEPTGASFATIPMPEGFLQGLRDLTSKYEVVLIFDEVIGGFRWSPGGVQAKAGVTPDLTTLAKIVAGGLPGGAVVGKRDLMEQLRFKDGKWNLKKKVLHNGTFNANPLSAVAGITCLDILADGRVHAFCDGQAAKLRAGFNQIMNKLEVEGCAWGESSVFHLALGVPVPVRGDGDLRDPQLPPEQLKRPMSREVETALSLAMLHEGVHLFHSAGLLSIAHDDNVIEDTLKAFERSLVRMQECKLL
jgi:glutamate-1-semialdehyde 2,1-aminomutase